MNAVSQSDTDPSAAGFGTSAAGLHPPQGSGGRVRSAEPQADAVFVKKLNRIFFDVEAEQYDDQHPEILAGEADWWISSCEKLVQDLKSSSNGSGLAILDIGCGTGFVSSVLSTLLVEGDLMIGLDQSEGMLKRARSKVPADKVTVCRFARGDAANLQFVDQSFHMLTVNAFLHHVYDYRSVLSEIDRVLKPGGYVVLAHEPNKAFFQSPVIRAAASAWKLIGFGVKVPKKSCDKINARLRESHLTASDVHHDEILRLVEYHSPVEQKPIGIDKSKGFSLQEFLDQELRGYTVVEVNEYSTFYHRPLLERYPRLMRLAKTAENLFSGTGNLFSAVLRKAAA